MNVAEAALDFSSKNVSVFPCNTNKTPMTPSGFKDATDDEATIKAWWSKWPNAAIGVPTGAINDIIVLDVDKDDDKFIDGEVSLKSFPELPPTRTVRTPRGGKHIYFKHPGGVIKNSTSKIGEGLDIRGDGGYVIAPPSHNGNGLEYSIELDVPVAEVPGWLKLMIVEKPRKIAPAPTPAVSNSTDRAKIENALTHVSPSCHYAEWIDVGMALHSWNPSEGRYLWDAWSRKSEKYEEGLIDKKWPTFKQGAITISTLFGKAKDAGWKPYRDIPVVVNKTPSVLKPLSSPTTPEEFYYEKYSKEYLLRNKRRSWMSLAETQFKKEMAYRGMNTRTEKGNNVSEVDEFIIKLRDTNDIDYAGPLAGYASGFYEMNGFRVLVTESPVIIEPSKGDWPVLKKLIQGLLFDANYSQQLYLFGWIKLAYESLRAGHRRPGQVLVICGPHDCGKSLLQLIITKILGGRSSKPYSYMTATTEFNGELFTAEHLVIEDEPAGTDLRMRRSFGAQIKQIAGCDTQRCHAKHQQAITLTPFWRLSITLNDESENLMVLPPIDDSIEDKMIMLKASNAAMPMPTGTNAERDLFWNQLMSELPAFLDYLVNWEIPEELKKARYGISHFHHPVLLREIDALSPEFRLLAIIDKDLFGNELSSTWLGTSEDLEVFLTQKGNYQYETRKLLSWNNACGTYLGRLSKKYPARFVKKHTEKGYTWTITPL